MNASKQNVMSHETADHFYRWLNKYVADDEQRNVEQKIHALLRDYPGLVAAHSWPEMRALADSASTPSQQRLSDADDAPIIAAALLKALEEICSAAWFKGEESQKLLQKGREAIANARRTK